jgi:hypothetical protein
MAQANKAAANVTVQWALADPALRKQAAPAKAADSAAAAAQAAVAASADRKANSQKYSRQPASTPSAPKRSWRDAR